MLTHDDCYQQLWGAVLKDGTVSLKSITEDRSSDTLINKPNEDSLPVIQNISRA